MTTMRGTCYDNNEGEHVMTTMRGTCYDNNEGNML